MTHRSRGIVFRRSAAFLLCLASACSIEPGNGPSTKASLPPPFLTRLPSSLEWHEHARVLVTANGLGPQAAARLYALLSVAQYRALTASPQADKQSGEFSRSVYEWERGAVAGASRTVLAFLFPATDQVLDSRVRNEGVAEDGRLHPDFERGYGSGVEAARPLVERAARDHFSDPWRGSVPAGPGRWTAKGPPVLPGLGTMTPFLLTSSAQFRPAAPPALESSAFKTDLDEIRTISATRTLEQLAIARRWNMSNGTITTGGYWNQVASRLIEENGLDQRAAAHILAVMNVALMDAVIGCWEAKYFYWTLRPSQSDSTITLPIGLPNHPSYPSGHSCGSSAMSTVLAFFFPPHADSLNEQTRQAGLSRMYGGIHYQFDVTAGQQLGKSVAEWAIELDRTRGLLSAIR